MNRRILRIVLVTATLAALVALSFPAYPAENATIMGDGVNVRNAPSRFAEIDHHVSKEARVEVIAKTDYTDTIQGHTAPWYKLQYPMYNLPLFVFGAYVELDAGVEVPTISLKSGNGDVATAFILEGLYAFGKHKSDVKKKLGEPISETKERGKSIPGGEEYEFYLYTLVYDGVVIRDYESAGGEWIYEVSYTGEKYDIRGVRVGSSVADMERFLGSAFKDSGDVVPYYYHFHWKTDGGRITEITFTFSAGD
jgi:hypothetical protein